MGQFWEFGSQFWAILAHFWPIRGNFEAHFEPIQGVWRPFWAILVHFWPIRGIPIQRVWRPFWVDSGDSETQFGLIQGVWRPFCSFGSNEGVPRPIFVQLWGFVSQFWVRRFGGPFWANSGGSGANSGDSGANFGVPRPIFGQFWGFGSQFWAIFCHFWSIRRMPRPILDQFRGSEAILGQFTGREAHFGPIQGVWRPFWVDSGTMTYTYMS